MSEIFIQLDNETRLHRPGERLQGLVKWSLKPAPRSVEVRLFWFTTGASPQQIGLVEKIVFADPPFEDSRRFAFILPAKPWSFRGRLTILRWAVEAVLLPTRTCARCLFDLSPAGHPILLPSLDTDEKHF
jgi:hypothetical protein